jgi:hypothetical protein
MEAVQCAKRAAREARRMATREHVRETKKTNRTSERIGQLESLCSKDFQPWDFRKLPVRKWLDERP